LIAAYEYLYYNWNIVESGVKHHKPKSNIYIMHV